MGLLAFIKPLVLLTGAYLVFLLPMAWQESCLFGYRYKSKLVRAAIVSWYWWLCGVNFIIYYWTSPRIRQAYLKFLGDITYSRRTKEKKQEELSDTFWARGMENGHGNNELEVI